MKSVFKTCLTNILYTMTSLAPGVFAGVDKVMVRESITVTFEAASVPKFTLVPSIKLAP